MKIVITMALLVITSLAVWRCSSGRPDQNDRQITTSSKIGIPPVGRGSIERKMSLSNGKRNAPFADPETTAKVFVVNAYDTDIDFWGKVVDESGIPVPAASVNFVVSNKYFGDGSEYRTTTDANGLFSLMGVKGLSLSVRLEKAGYYLNEGESRATIGYGYQTDSKGVRPPPTKDQPSIFVLRKAKPSGSVVKAKGWRLKLPQDGKPIGIRLEGVNTLASPAQAHLVIETQLDLSRINERNQFPWSCRISVPGGGLIERSDKMNFEAPAFGYRAEEIVTVDLSGSRPEEWRSSMERDYFLRLPDDKFARVRLSIRISELESSNIVYYEGLWDPSGSKNLEIGPDDLGNPQ